MDPLRALDEVIPPHLRSTRHGENFLGERYNTIRSALEALRSPQQLSLADFDCSRDDYIDVRRELLRQVTALPWKGTRVERLTAQQKFALAYAAGAPYTSEVRNGLLTFRTTVPVGIADRGDGGWIVAIGSAHKDPW